MHKNSYFVPAAALYLRAESLQTRVLQVHAGLFDEVLRGFAGKNRKIIKFSGGNYS